MAIRKCSICSRPFNSVGAKICSECMKNIDGAYARVRKYIYQNPDKADFASIVENVEIPEKMLSYLIESGLVEVNKSGSGVKCKICGAETSSGPICENCRLRMLSEKLSNEGHNVKKAGNNLDNWKWLPLSYKKNEKSNGR